MEKEAEALALELNDNSIHTHPKPDLNTEEKLQKVEICAIFTQTFTHFLQKRAETIY